MEKGEKKKPQQRLCFCTPFQHSLLTSMLSDVEKMVSQILFNIFSLLISSPLSFSTDYSFLMDKFLSFPTPKWQVMALFSSFTSRKAALTVPSPILPYAPITASLILPSASPTSSSSPASSPASSSATNMHKEDMWIAADPFGVDIYLQISRTTDLEMTSIEGK